MKRLLLLLPALLLLPLWCTAQEATTESIEFIPYGDMNQWITRHIKESGIIGGNTKTIYAIGPTQTIDSREAYLGTEGVPWATSNVMARVAGITKTNNSVFVEQREGYGYCARLETRIEKCVVLGLVNIKVIAAGSIFLGIMQEPITGASDPMAKMDTGIPFTRRPKAIMFDYKCSITGEKTRRKMTGKLGNGSTVEGMDYADCVLYLQHRWEDKEGKIYAHRVATMVVRYGKTVSSWHNNARYAIHYGDITKESFYRSYMGLTSGDDTKYAKNSKGEMVPINEVGWGTADEKVTHMILQFDSSHGGAYVGSVGNTLWIDNIRLVY